jgi:enoyl-CoA hydratase/carnithine racemase
MAGETLDAAAALRLGLADIEASEESLRAIALQHAQRYAAGAPLAVQAMRATLRAPLVAAFQTALDHELRLQLQHMQSQDFFEGAAALMGGRQARFIGA